jgi:hypothetical protein
MGRQNRRDFLKATGGALVSSKLLSSLQGLPVAMAVEKGRSTGAHPNILLFFPDQFRYDCVTGNSNNIPVRTPDLSKLAGEGVWQWEYSLEQEPLGVVEQRSCRRRIHGARSESSRGTAAQFSKGA